MEQKQLDELEDYTEEFIEDETPEEHMVLKARRERKALAMKRLTEKAAKDMAEKEKEALRTVKSTSKMKATEVKMEPIKVETYTDDEIMITPVKEELKSVKTAPPVEVSTPINPWAGEEKKEEGNRDTGFFQDVSTWQAFTGILIILLIFSVFTQGFQFKAEGVEIQGVTDSEKGGEEAAAVVGQESSEEKNVESAVTTPVTNSTDATTSDIQSAESKESEVVVSTIKTVPRQVSLGARKWRFSSEKIVVKQNDHVILTVRPESMTFTFAIKDLDVEKEVSGITVIEFDALEKGTFGFSCSSCEEWRGMTGTLIVE